MSSPSLLARHVQRLAAKAIGGKQPDLVGLMQAWPEVVGATWAGRTTPIGLKPARGGEPAKLELAVPAAETLLVQHETPLLLSRINAYFGHGAIGALLIKRMEKLETTAPSRPKPPLTPLDIEGIDDPELAAALGRLGAAIRAERKNDSPSSPSINTEALPIFNPLDV